MRKPTIVINPEFEHLRPWIETVPQPMAQGQGEVLWEGRNSIRRLPTPIPGLDVVAKKFKVPMLHQRMAYSWFRPSKARRAFEFATIFHSKNIPTPTPIAFIEQKRGGLFHTGYFISVAVPGIELRQPMEAGKGTPGMMQALVAQIREMHEAGIAHGDLNLTNFLGVDIGQDQWRLQVVDLNRSRFLNRPLTEDERVQNFKRLTHVRPLYVQAASEYAHACNFEPDEFVQKAVSALDRFER